MTRAAVAQIRKNVPAEKSADNFYRAGLLSLNAAGLPYLVGGAYALRYLTGIVHRTKDLDLFVRRSDRQRVLTLLAEELGCQTVADYSHWLAKAYWHNHVIDVIFSTGNGQAQVDDHWLAQGVPGEVLGVSVRLCPVEETIWTKAFIMERERYDGADVAHLLRSCGHRIDWKHLLDLFGSDWPVLLSHLILFRYIYPGERDAVPAAVLEELVARLAANREPSRGDLRLCRGSLLSRAQYVCDTGDWGYLDARVYPFGRMTAADADAWSAAAED